MGVRILLGITLVSLLVVLGSSVYADEEQSWDIPTVPLWDSEARTTQDEHVGFRFADEDGRVRAFRVSVRGTCDWGEELLRRWGAHDTGKGARWVLRGDRLRVGGEYTTAAGGWTDRTEFTMDARVRKRSIDGTVSMDETFTGPAGEVTRCHARHVGFSVPRD